RFPPRMLFTLAHELGHLLAHLAAASDAIYADEAPEDESYRGSSPRTKLERYANRFAAALLLPKQGVGVALRTIHDTFSRRSADLTDVDILYVSRIFGTSFQVTANRCEQLTLLPQGGAISLYEELKARHGNPEKRADDLGLPARERFWIPAVPQAL